MGAGVGATIAADGGSVRPGVASCSGVENAGRLWGIEFALVGTLATAVAFVLGVVSTAGVGDGARMLGVEVAAIVALTAGADRADPGVRSALGVEDDTRILVLGTPAADADCVALATDPAPGVGDGGSTLEFKVAVLGPVFILADCVDGTSKIVFSIPNAERKITMSETQLIMWSFSLRFGFRCMPS